MDLRIEKNHGRVVMCTCARARLTSQLRFYIETKRHPHIHEAFAGKELPEHLQFFVFYNLLTIIRRKSYRIASVRIQIFFLLSHHVTTFWQASRRSALWEKSNVFGRSKPIKLWFVVGTYSLHIHTQTISNDGRVALTYFQHKLSGTKPHLKFTRLNKIHLICASFYCVWKKD